MGRGRQVACRGTAPDTIEAEAYEERVAVIRLIKAHAADCERRGPLDGVDGGAVAAAAEALEERADRGPVLRRGAFKTPRSLYGSTKDTAHLEAPST